VLALFLLPSIVQKNLRITFPTGMQIVILIHIFATEFLGEIACYYVQYPHWDSIVHTVWGFLCAAIGYLLVDLLNRDMPERFHLSPAYLAVAAFCFSMTIGVLWEFFEFAMDRLFLMDMQKDTIIPQFASTLLDETHHNIPVVVSGIDSVTVNGQVLASGGYLDIGLYPCSFGIWELQSLESLHQKSLRDIWNGEQFTQYRSKMKEKCSSCSMTSLCRLGCRLDLDIDLCYS
ncbi:MAG: SPASM domain-containing protein, partial [Oscillospiraceae bacterium]|nr:SPASM domain-containing protein [Oscillospiraceae bacterium]